jgi:hypothetical protein
MMRRFVLPLLVILVLLVIFVPNSSDPWDHSGNTNPGDRSSGLAGAWQLFRRLITAIRDVLYLFAELILDLLNRAWQATPPRYKVIYGIFFTGMGVLAFVGLLALGAVRGLSRRLG